MNIGIISAGPPPIDRLEYPSFAAMIEAALGTGNRYREFDATARSLPDSSSAADAYFITGSPACVHDKEPWIASLREWVDEADPNIPLVGICFGHQLMAEVHGGVVKRSDKGLGLGLHHYEICAQEQWMDDARSFVIPAVHYDQVVDMPPASRLVATSTFCRHAVLAYSDRRALSFQGHPEFALDFTAQVVDQYQQNGVIDADQAAVARQSMHLKDDRALVFGWIRRFLEMNIYRR